jgi:hypothetical protein
MGIYRLESYLEKDLPNQYCWQVSIKKLADEFRDQTGRDPMMVVDGSYSLRTIYVQSDEEWMQGGQMKAFVKAMKNFISAFEVRYRHRTLPRFREVFNSLLDVEAGYPELFL